MLPMLESHRTAAPESAYEGKEIVPVKTLDAVAGQYLKDARAPFLKIDTQGFEWQVLDGARDTLPYIKGMLVELSRAARRWSAFEARSDRSSSGRGLYFVGIQAGVFRSEPGPHSSG
jgi:methyltransferase FkbM-like protein